MNRPFKLLVWSAIGVLSIGAYLLFLVPKWGGQTPEPLAQAKPAIPAGSKVSFPGSTGSSNTKLLGAANIRQPTPEERQLTDRLLAASKNLRPLDGAAPEPRATELPRNLLPKSPKLSDAQQRVLQKLRWGTTKDLSYRGDGDDATVRMLSSAALASPADLSAPPVETAEERALRFVAENRELFLLKSPNDELVVTAVEADSNGGKIVRMAQRFNGLEVWSGHLTANLSSAGYLTVITATYAPTPESVALTPQIQPDAAVAAARQYVGISQSLEVNAPMLKIFADKGRTPELAYEVQLRAPAKLERVFVSAATGVVLLSVSEICNAGVVGTGTDLLNQTRTLNVLPSGTPQRFYLQDTSKPMYSPATGVGVITVYDASGSAPSASSSATLNGGYDPAAVSAAFNLGKVYDFYLATFNRNSFDGKGSTILGLVRFPDPTTHGLWDNAHWDGQKICFGSAENFAGASDVVGHEYSHAVIQTTAALVYDSESGALNESFADIFGESFERYLSGVNDWLLGTSLKAPFRNMKDPSSKGQPATMSQYARLTTDHGGVHTNSGITNHAFYYLAEGQPAGAIGFDSARNIFYRALTTKLNSRSDFQDLRAACVLSAAELFGVGSVQATRTGQAFDAVEIYDANVAEAPQNLTPPTGPDSYLIAYKAVDGNTYLGRREAALGDGSTVTGISTFAMNAAARASVSGDGSQAIFVSATNDAILANTNGTAQSAAGLPGSFNSVALSADGKYFACIARDPLTRLPINKILYLSTATLASTVIDLYLPVADGPNSLQITTVDEVDLSPDGQVALFDGLAKTTFADGTSVQAWSIFAVDLRTKSVFTLAGPLKDLNVGNPAFARSSAQRIVFEAIDSTSNYVLAYDLGRGVLATVRQFTPGNSYLAYPRFSAGDDFVVFTEQFFSLSTFTFQPRVSRISLLLDRITASGASSALQDQAYSGLSYRRGVFAGSPTLSVAALTSSLTSAQSGTFRISRISGDRAIRVPVTFKTLGTARPVSDYGQIALNTAIPAGASFVDVSVKAAASLSPGTRTITLSLDPQYHYLIAANSGDASMTVVGAATTPLVITLQPKSQTLTVGSTLALGVGPFGGTGSYTYQWRFNGLPLVNSASSTYTATNIGTGFTGTFDVIVSDGVSAVTSAPAIITVNPAVVPPSIATQPASQSATAGNSVTFASSASGTGPFTYQWRKDGVAISGATGATLTLSNVQSTAAGSYTVVVTSSAGSTTSNAATLTVTIPNPGRLINLSVLAPLATAGDSFSLGYVVSGASATNPKPLVVRAAGPSLGALGYPGTLIDPKVELFAGPTKTSENDNWGGFAATTAAMAAVGAFAYAAPTSLDAAIAANITSRDNSVKISAGAFAPTGTGAVIAEVYDATPAASLTIITPRLINFSVLKNVGTSVTLGFVIGGSTSETVLVRAVGPSLGIAPFGLVGVMADPKVELFDATGKSLATNDNWGGTTALTTAFSATGAFILPATSKDAALAATLAPGNYSVVVTPVTGTASGTALLEVYEVP